MRLFFLLLAIIACNFSYAQTDTLEYYLNRANNICVPEYASTYRRAWKEGDWWRVKDFYTSTGTIKSNGIFASHERDTFGTEQGMFYYYHSNGKIEKKVRYINGLTEGVVKVYNEDGRLTDSGLYKKGIPYKARYMWNKDGNIIFKGIYDDTGIGIGEEWEYHDNGKLGGYGKTGLAHKKDSVWTYYHSNGQVSSIEYYRSDSLLDIRCYEEDGKLLDSCHVEKMPEPPYDVNKFLGYNMRYPEGARDNGIGGRVTVQFVIDVDGSVSDIKAVAGVLGYGLGQEAMRVVSLMPNWTPGKQHNRPVKVYFNLPISFRID